jgi:hypothetical protein
VDADDADHADLSASWASTFPFAALPQTSEVDATLRIVPATRPWDRPWSRHAEGAVLFHDHVRLYEEPSGTWALWDGTSLLRTEGATDAVLHLHPGSLDAEGRLHPTLAWVSLCWLLHRLDVFHLHGALLAPSGGAPWLLTGASGSGKSTTCLSLMAEGGAWWTDDAVLLGADADGLQVAGVARPFHLTARTLALHPGLEGLVRGPALQPGKVAVEVARCWPPVSPGPAPMPAGWVVLLGVHAGPTEAVPLTLADAWVHLLEASVWATVPHLPRRPQHEHALHRLLERLPVVGLRLGPDVLGHPDRLRAIVSRSWGSASPRGR